MPELLHSFSLAAATYDRHADAQRELAAWLAEWLPRTPQGRALEIGAGTGNLTRLAGVWPDGYTATDLSPEMCVVGGHALPLIDWQTMAAEHPLPGPWDWMFSSAMLQWIEDPSAVFRAWREQLAPGGRVVAALFVADSLPEWRAWAAHVDPVRWRTVDEWQFSLRESGLKLLRGEVQNRTFWHASARDFLRSLHGVGAAPRRRLTPGTLRRLLDGMDETWNTPRGFPASWTFYRFEAENPGV